jgi:hypothetical protein
VCSAWSTHPLYVTATIGRNNMFVKIPNLVFFFMHLSLISISFYLSQQLFYAIIFSVHLWQGRKQMRKDRKKGDMSVVEKTGKANKCERNGNKRRTSVVKTGCVKKMICFYRASARGQIEFLYSRKVRFHLRMNQTAIMTL